MPQIVQSGTGASQWFVACLCAAWCDTCRDYRTAFENLARENAASAFVWVDIEDDSDWLGDVDIENFPTVLICRDAAPHFFGTLLPHIGQLAKLVASVKSSNTALRTVDEDLQQLAGRLRAAVISGSDTGR